MFIKGIPIDLHLPLASLGSGFGHRKNVETSGDGDIDTADGRSIYSKSGKTVTWMSRWKLGSMVRTSGWVITPIYPIYK